MRIGIVGAGRLGTALAHRLGLAGHSIKLSFSRDLGAMAETARHHGAVTGTPDEAAAFGDVMALTVTWPIVPQAVRLCGAALDGRILWDCTSTIRRGMTGLEIGTTTSGAEVIAGLAPAARVVKGVPTFADLLMSDDPTVVGRPVSTFVAVTTPTPRPSSRPCSATCRPP